MKRKLVIIIDNLMIGGGQSVVLELVKNIETSRFETTVVCYGIKRKTFIEEQLEEICDVVYMNITGKISLIDYAKVLRKLSELNPDVVHAHLGGITFALPWCVLHKRPLVVTAHTIPEKAFSKKNEMQLRLGLKCGKIILVAVSAENCEKCKKYFAISSERCRCVNNGVDKEKYFIVGHEGFNFINVATHNENKNQEMLVTSFAQIVKKYTGVKLILVGDGPTHSKLIDHAKKLGIEEKVVFTGKTDNPEIYYKEADVYVQSSHREAMPMSVLEAMMAGMPVIATNVGGLSDVVKENGFLIDDNDVQAMSLSMENLLEMNQESLQTMRDISKKIASNYSSEKMANRYMDIYDEMLE